MQKWEKSINQRYMNISFLSFGVPDEAALSLIRCFEFEYKNGKIPSRKCFPQNGALCGTNSDIVGLQCRHRIPGGKPQKKNYYYDLIVFYSFTTIIYFSSARCIITITPTISWFNIKPTHKSQNCKNLLFCWNKNTQHSSQPWEKVTILFREERTRRVERSKMTSSLIVLLALLLLKNVAFPANAVCVR